MRKHGLLIAILLVCFALRFGVAVIGASDGPMTADPDGYWEIAGNLASGEGFAWKRSVGLYRSPLATDWCPAPDDVAPMITYCLRGAEGGMNASSSARPTAMRPPLYPAVLAGVRRLVGDVALAGLALQSLFDAATCWLMFLLARKLFDARTGLIAAALWAVYPVSVSQATRFWTEPLCALFITVGLAGACAWRARRTTRCGAFGLCLGFAALTRPASLVAAPLVALWGQVRKGRAWPKVARAYALGLAIALVLLPWVLRNRLLYRETALTTHSGYTLFLGNAALREPAWWVQVERVGAIERARGMVKPLADSMPRQEAVTFADQLPNRGEAGEDAVFRKLAFMQMRAQPLRYVALSGLRVLRLWFNVGYGHWPSAKSWGVAAINAALLALACVGWKRRKSRRAAMVPIVLVALSQTLVYAFIIAYVRFIVPVMPGVIVMAAAGATSLWPRSASSPPVPAADAPPPAAS